MDNNSSQFIESIITGVMYSVVRAIDPKLDQLNRTQEVFRENVENLLERKLDNNINITGNINKSLIICGDSNCFISLNFKDYIKYKDDVNFQTRIKYVVDKIKPLNFTINIILKKLNTYQRTNKISFLNTARRLWQKKFIFQIDSFSKDDTFQDVPISELYKIQSYLSSKYHRNITKQFIQSDINIENLLKKVRQIRKSIGRLISFLKLQDMGGQK